MTRRRSISCAEWPIRATRCWALIEKYQDRRLADRVFDLTWTHSQVVLRQLNATEADAQLYGRLASSVLYANASLRGAPSVLLRNRRGQSALWGYAISGDLPIVLLQISKAASIDLVRQLVQAHAYWRLKGLAVDLVIWNEDHDVYRQQLQEQILGLIAAGVEAHFVDRPGGIFVRHAEQISNEDRLLFESVARVIISDARGTLAEQVSRRAPVDVRVPRLTPTRTYRPEPPLQPIVDDLILFNGLGGFTPDGREYVIAPPEGEATPAPWVNVLANPNFGTVVSETGQAYTWSTNAHLYRLTPWHNDAIGEANGEAIYIRDEETGKFWSPSSSAVSAADDIAPTVTRHGFGYSVFERIEDDIHSELTVFVALDASVKFSVLKITNRSDRPRRLSVTGYVEWVLGDLRTKSTMHVTTEIDCQVRRDLRPQPLQQRIRRVDRILRCRRSHAHGYRRSDRIHRPQPQLAQSGGAATHAPVGPSRRRTGSMRRDAGDVRPRARAGARGRVSPRRCEQRRGSQRTGAAFSRCCHRA